MSIITGVAGGGLDGVTGVTFGETTGVDGTDGSVGSTAVETEPMIPEKMSI